MAEDDPITMQEIDPSPVEESPPLEADLEKRSNDPNPYFPRTNTIDLSSKSTTSALGLSHRLPTILHTLQKYSTIPPSIYLTFHITNTSLIPLITRSVRESDKYLLLTRPYYQSFPFEQLLIFVPITTHVLSGIALRLYHRRQNAIRHGAETFEERKRVPWPKLSAQSLLGYMLWPLFAGHVFVNRILPKRTEGGSSGVGLRYVAHGFARHPIIANLGYAMLVSMASFHFVGGAAKWLKLSKEYITESGDYGRRERKKRGWMVNGVAAAVTAVWMLGGLGVVGRGGAGTGWEARNWDALYEKVPVFGGWLT